MPFLPDGSVRHGSVYRALVANKAKLIYEEIGDWLEGVTPVPPSVISVPGLREQLVLQNNASRILRKYRRETGALELNTIEPNPVLENGAVKDIVVQKQNLARCLIEEFMVAANGTMMAFLGGAGLPMIQRTVRTPRYWDEIVATAAALRKLSRHCPMQKHCRSSFFAGRMQILTGFPTFRSTIVKLLGPGEYSTLEPGAPPVGHFSLAVVDYTHATAPNRRYVDIVNQRLAKSVLDQKQSPYTLQELADLAERLTDREKASKKVKRYMRKAVAAVLLHSRTGDLFDGIVTGASEKGTYIRLIAPPAEGRIIRGEKSLWIGQKIRVRLLRTDPYNGFIDFSYAP